MQNRVNLAPHFEECFPTGNYEFHWELHGAFPIFQLFQAFQLCHESRAI
jgi:hypothetical protein